MKGHSGPSTLTTVQTIWTVLDLIYKTCQYVFEYINTHTWLQPYSNTVYITITRDQGFVCHGVQFVGGQGTGLVDWLHYKYVS